MNSTLSMGVTLLLAAVSGIAVWGRDTAANPRALRMPSEAAVVPTNAAPADATSDAPAVVRAGAEEELARDLLRALDSDQLARAVLGGNAGPEVMLHGAASPAAMATERGLPWLSMREGQRALCWWLLRRLAETCCGTGAAAELARIDDAALLELSFAWAGSTDSTGGGNGVYCRLQGPHFAVEYYRPAGAMTVHLAWRDFTRDAGAPWLRDQLAVVSGR